MPELLILRHGKSDYPDGVGDFDRPLKKRGERAAAQVGRWLRRNDLVPDIVVSSPAERAIDTAHLVCEAMGFDPDDIRENRDIYLAAPETLLKIVRDLPETTDRAMLVGHNPGLEQLLQGLAETRVSSNDDSGRMPTCALAVLRLPKPWAETRPRSAALVTLIRPRDLPSED